MAAGSGEIQPGKLIPAKRSQMLSLSSLFPPSPKFKVYLLIPLSEVCAENSYLDFTGSSWHQTKIGEKHFILLQLLNESNIISQQYYSH